MRFLPGDPALAILSMGGEGSFTDQDLQRMREKLGTDKPYHIQYVLFVKNTATGDFGESFFYPGIKVAELLRTRFPLSMELAIFALTISYVIAVPIGVPLGGETRLLVRLRDEDFHYRRGSPCPPSGWASW